MGEGEFRVELRDREPGPTGCDEIMFLIRPNPACRSGRSPRPPRAASFPASHSRSPPCGRRDPRVRRDRCRDRRRHRTPGRRDAGPARRARAGDHDHPPAADRERRRTALPGREGARRPDPHADRGASGDERRAELERMLGGEEFLARSRRSPDRDRGRRHRPARAADEGPRQATSARRPRDHRPRRSRSGLGRGARRVGVRAVVNVSPSTSGRFPEPRAARARPGRRLSRRRSRVGPLRRALRRRDA